ncbi:MAG: hypothetical protein AB8G96_14450 [Phycisphaerales bacterium]
MPSTAASRSSATAATRSIHPAILASVITAAPLLAVTAASAVDPVSAYFNTPQDFGYQVQWMPDIDQQWDTLPNNGNMYCLPASGLNMLAFAAHWGEGIDSVASGTWEDNSAAENVALVNDLGFLAALSGTSPTGGTSVTGLANGLEAYIGDAPYSVVALRRNETFYPDLATFGLYGPAGGGALMSVGYGRYDWELIQPGSVLRLLDRNGGHMCTVQTAINDGGQETLIVRDPGSGGSLTTQSNYAFRSFGSVLSRTALSDANDDGAFSPVEVTTLGVQSNGQMRVIDFMATVIPVYVGGFQGGTVTFQPVGGGFTIGQNPTHVELAPGSLALDLALPSDPGRAIVLVQEPTGAHSIQAVHRDGRATVRLQESVAPDAVMDIDRFGTLRFSDGRQIFATPAEGPRSGQMEPELETIAPFVIAAMAPDTATDGRWVFDETGACSLLGIDGQPVAPTLLLPAVQAAREAARRTAALGDGIPTVFLLAAMEDGDAVFRVRAIPGAGLDAERILAPTDGLRFESISEDRRGQLLLGTAGGGHKVVAEGPSGQYEFVSSDWYDDFPPMQGIEIARSVVNVVPETDEDVAWRNIDPSELGGEGDVEFADCTADIDGDGEVGIGDLLRVLGGWGEAGISDIAPALGDGTTDIQDLLAVLAAWGPCE